MFGLRALGALPYTGRPETAVSGAIKWYLNVVSPPNGYMTLKTPLDNIDYGLAQYAIEFKVTVSASGLNLLGVNGPAIATNNSIGFTSSGRFQIGAGGSTYFFTNTNAYILDGLPHVYRFEHDANGAWRFYRDGVLFQSGVKSTSVTPAAPIGVIFAIGTNMTGTNCQFYYLAMEGFGAGSGVWSADTSGGVGNKLLSSSGNDATQAGTWSNSGWVPYLDSSVSNALVPQPVSGAVKWYLNNTTSVSAIVRIPDIIVGATVGDYIEFKAVASAGNPSSAYRMMGANNNNWTDLIELNPSNILFRAGGNNSNIPTASGYTQPALGIIFTFKAVKASASTWQIFLNGSPVGSPLANGGSITVGSLFAVQGPTTIESFRGGVYYVAFSTNGGVSATRYYDPSVGNGGSTTLIDTIGGQHGTYTGDWATGARYMPYLDTTVSTPIVNQGVNGTANYFCALNGTSYFTAPTLGNLLTGSPKIRINIKKFKQFGSSVEPIFWQGGNSWGTREFSLRNNSTTGNIIIGGVATNFAWSDLTNAFGDPNLTCDEFGFEINGTNAIFYKNKVAVFTVPNLSKGTSRLEGALLFFGAQPANDSAGSISAISIVPNGMQYGDIEIFINDVLVRNYKNTNGNGAGYVDVLQPIPYALRYNAGGNRYMALPQSITIADNEDFEIEFECAFNNDSDFRIFGVTASVSNRIILVKGTGATIVRLTVSNGSATDWTVTYTKTDFNVFRFKRVSNIIELFVNGVSQGTRTQAAGLNAINSFFTQGGFYSDSGTVRFIKFTIGNVLTHHYVNLTGSGTNWTDIVSGNNATPINTWPTDNSQWIEYAHLQQRGTFTIDNNEWRQYIENIVSAVTAKVIKWFNGTAWVSKPIKWFNGTAWVQKTFKR